MSKIEIKNFEMILNKISMYSIHRYSIQEDMVLHKNQSETMDFQGINKTNSNTCKNRLYMFLSVCFTSIDLFESIFSLNQFSCILDPLFISISIVLKMSDKKTSATATSATKKAAAGTKKPVTATPAPPKAEVYHIFSTFSFHFIIL